MSATNAIPTILKGDDSGPITLTIAEGRVYAGATLVVAYRGVTRQFTDLVPGGSVALSFTHEETAAFPLGTAPLLMRLVGQYGAEETVENAEARIKVTDCLGEVNAGGSFIVRPGQQGGVDTKVPITDVGDVANRYTLADLQAKVNQIVHVLAQRSLLSVAAAAALAFTACGGVTTNRFDSLYSDDFVVTGVSEEDPTVADWARAGQPRPVADLGPAFEYTTAVSNRVESDIGVLALVKEKTATGTEVVSNGIDFVVCDDQGATGRIIIVNGMDEESGAYVELGMNQTDGMTFGMHRPFGDGSGYGGVSAWADNAESDMVLTGSDRSEVFVRTGYNQTAEIDLSHNDLLMNANVRIIASADDSRIEIDGKRVLVEGQGGALPANALVLTNSSVQTVGGTAVTAADVAGGVTPNAVTNVANYRISQEVAPWAMAGHEPPVGMPVTGLVSRLDYITGEYSVYTADGNHQIKAQDVYALSSTDDNVVKGVFDGYDRGMPSYKYVKVECSGRASFAESSKYDKSGNDIELTYVNKTTTNDCDSVFATNILARADAAMDSKIQPVNAIVATWENFLDGSNVVFSITNYISGAYNLDAAKLRIKELRDGEYREVFNSRDEIVLHINDFSNKYVRASINALTDEIANQLKEKADKNWGKYTSAGGIAPSNTVYMTANNTVFAGGMEYERVAVGEGTIAVLTTKGAPTYTQGDEGTFKFQDGGGTNYFGFAKTDSYTIGANTDGINVDNNIVTLTYDVTMSGTPCVWYTESLESPITWEQLNTPDGQPISGASHIVSWEQNPEPNTQVCYINCPESKGFFKATIEVAGEAKFMTNMPADLGGGILCPNTATGVMGVIRPSFNGSSVTWTWSAK